MTAELSARLERVRAAMARTSDPLGDPLGLDFEPRSGRWHRENWQRFVAGARAGRVHDRVVVYVHLPFCAKICSYCLLSAQRPDKKETMSRYVDAIVLELRRHGELLAGLPVSSLHVGGGTPTLLTLADLERVLSEAERAFVRTPDFASDLEAHPMSSTPDKLACAKNHGIRRVSFGVESFTRRVLELSNRGEQRALSVVAAVKNARLAGLEVNIDLLAGLPGETMASFEDSLNAALELEVDAISVNRYLAEGSALGDVGYSPDAAEIELASEMLARADELIRAHRPEVLPPPAPRPPSWGAQYHFSRGAPARSYSQQDMIDPGSVVAIGHGGMGRVHAGYHFIADRNVAAYTNQVLSGEDPDVLVCPSDARFEMAFFVVDRACHQGISDADFSAVFRRNLAAAFGSELDFLLSQGLLTKTSDSFLKPERRDFDAATFVAFLANRSGTAAETPSSRRPRVGALDAVELVRGPGAARAVDHARTEEYGRIDSELPPSLLWCRLAMRAARAARKRSPT